MLLQWVILPIVGRKLTRSRDGVGGQMGRNGGAPKMHLRTPSTASGTWTEVAIVQESLWNHKIIVIIMPFNLCRVWHRQIVWLGAVVATVGASETCPCTRWEIVGVYALEAMRLSWRWSLYPMGYLTLETGTSITVLVYDRVFAAFIMFSALCYRWTYTPT